jgi:N-acetylmuramoyl-L-alanine amidase
MFFLVTCASVAQADWTAVMCDNRRYVPIEEVAEFYKMAQPVSNGETFRMAAQGRSIVGRPGAKELLINGVKYVLCFPMYNRDGRVLISAMDVVKIIEPIMRPQKITTNGMVHTIVLDAGHGGQDSGARGPLGAEKDATLDVVLRARKLLMENGYQVRCTRLTDVFIPLDARAEIANHTPNSIFVSVHFNKSNTGGGTGIETYCLAPRGVPSMDEENLSYSDFQLQPGHARDPENVALATTVHAAMVRSLGMPDRGIKRARFLVIKNITVPGILVEGGFMSGADDARKIASPEYRQQLAQCILDGVNRYKQAVTGQPMYVKPTAIVSATDPTSIPNIDPAPKPTPVPAVGSKTDLDRSVVQAQGALQSAAPRN